jgi:hypothetical protein
VKHTVLVWGRPQEVSAHQSSKTVWIASGEYMGATIVEKGSSEAAAVMHWRKAAQYRGN